MAIIPREPVPATTKGGYNATVTDIDPTDTDSLKGTVSGTVLGTIAVRWDLAGICWDQTPDLSLDTYSSEDAGDVAITAKKLDAVFEYSAQASKSCQRADRRSAAGAGLPPKMGGVI